MGDLRVLRVEPSSTPPAGVIKGYASAWPETSEITFAMPPQALDVVQMQISFDMLLVKDGSPPTPVHWDRLGMNPKVGATGALSSYYIKRFTGSNIVDSNTNVGELAHMTSLLEHSRNSFTSYSNGLLVHPSFSTAVPALERQALSDQAAVNLFPPSDTNYLINAFFTPQSGALNAGYPLNLELFGGLSMVCVVARLFQLVQSCYPITEDSTQPELAYTSAAKKKLPYIPHFSNMIDTLTRTELASYHLYLVNPIMWVIVRPAAGLAIEKFFFNFSQIIPYQMYSTNELIITTPITSTELKSLTYIARDRANFTNPAFGPNTSMSLNIRDTTLSINGYPQFYAYPTQKGGLLQNLADFTTDSQFLAAMTDPTQAFTFRQLVQAAFIHWEYSAGNGERFDNVLFTSTWLVGETPSTIFDAFTDNTGRGAAPYYSWVTKDDVGIMPAALWGFNLRQQTYNQGVCKKLTIQTLTADTFANVYEMTTETGNIATSSFFVGENDDRLVLNQTGTTPAPLLGDSVYNPLAKFAYNKSTDSTIDWLVLVQKTLTLLVNDKASSEVPAARPALTLPRKLDFNTAAGRSTVERVIETRVEAIIVNNAPPNTLRIQVQLPDTGQLQSCILKLPLRNHCRLTTGYSCTTMTATNGGMLVPACNFFLPNGDALGAWVPTFTVGILNSGFQGTAAFVAGTNATTPVTPAADTNAPAGTWVNTWINSKGYATNQGTRSLIRGMVYQFAQNVMLQRLNLQEEAFINRSTRPFGTFLRESFYTSHISDGYSRADHLEGMYVDVDLASQYSLMLDPYKSIFQVSSSTNAKLSDHPLDAPHILTINLKYVDSVMAKMIGTQLNTTQKRYIFIDVDTRCIGMKDTAPGVLSGYMTDSTPWFIPSVMQLHTPAALATNAAAFKSIFGMPRWSIEPSITVNPYCIITTAFHSSTIQQNLVNDYTARGVEMTVDKYELQRQYLFDDFDGFASVQTQYNIAGRDPRIIKKIERYGCQVSGDFDIREAQNIWTREGMKPDLSMGGTTFIKKPLPYYMARDGAFGYAIPALKRLDLNNPDTNSNPAYNLQILIDNEDLFPSWKLGQAATNNLCHMIAHGKGIFRPDFEVSFVPSKRLVCDKKEVPRGVLTFAGNAVSFTNAARGSYAPTQILTNRLTLQANATAATKNPLVLNNYATVGQLPTRYVVTIPIRDEAANGTILTAITTGYTAETIKTTTDYHPMMYRALPVTDMSGLANDATLFALRSAWEQPVSVTRLWAYKQTSSLSFSPSTAGIREHLPTGVVVGTPL